MLAVAEGSYCADIPTILMDQDKFKTYFSERVTNDRNRWNNFENNLDDYNLQQLLTCMELFREELVFVLNNTDIPKDKPFEFLKRLSAIIFSMKNVKIGYDETKPLDRFLWDVFAGFDLITGYRNEDIIKNMISAI